MRTLGLIGGVTWHSTTSYYRGLNEAAVEALGPGRSADLVLRSLDYGAVNAARAGGDWRPLGRLVVRACRQVRAGGAEAIVLCSNSLHGVAHSVEAEVGLPLLHIGDALADGAVAQGIEHVALFGTAFTMAGRFIPERLEARGVRVSVPDDLDVCERIIRQELAHGVVTDAARDALVGQLDALVGQGAQAMVLGCTELGMLVGPGDVDVPVLDTLGLHVAQAAAFMVG